MNKLITVGMMAIALAGCSKPPTTDRTYESYGLINSEKKSDKVCYETNSGDVILGVLFFETAVVPVYTFGFDMYEPKRMKDKNGTCNLS